MQVFTFYSYKGGVGRTLACANFGLYLAKTGQKVVMIDMDFEAPGLDSKFPDVDVTSVGGMLAQFTAFQDGTEIPEIEALEINLPQDVLHSGGRLQLVPAGDYLSPDYYRRLSGLNWEVLLREEAGLAFCIELLRRVEDASQADVLLIDSRTGLTEVGGLCTQILPDTVVLITSTSRESIRGTQRIHEHISTSPIVSKRGHGRTKLDIRVVVARLPRPEDPIAYEERIRKKLGVEVKRIYYLFDQHDLCLDEYLALDKFDDHPQILDDYVELFASFNLEKTLPYLEKRLEHFRTQITRRNARENERILQELLILFPHPETMLEAARYYRLAKGGDEKAVANYLRYLDRRSRDREIVTEFAELCNAVSEADLSPKQQVARFLSLFGAQNMSAKLLARYLRLSDASGKQEIITAIESDDEKLGDPDFREIYLRSLYALGEWEKLIENTSEVDRSSGEIGLFVAEAFGNLGRKGEAITLLRNYRFKDPDTIIDIARIIFAIDSNVDLEDFQSIIGPGTRFGRDFPPLEYILERHGRRPHRLGREKDTIEKPEFRRWLTKLIDQSRQLPE